MREEEEEMSLTVYRCDACGAEFTMVEDEDLAELSCPVCLATVDVDDGFEDESGVDDDAEDQSRSE